jgi:hypothetical protein
MATYTSREPSFIDANRLYSLRGFYADSGVNPTRVREAARAGIKLPTLDVGKRKFVRGGDAIWFIEQLATLGAK